ncbi:MAG: hypothetical protein JWO47_689 [Candidatus Saccharibacteria bacterium]|nr:hypothetical protein [Candidatus Saccharibacteria bacterium]
MSPKTPEYINPAEAPVDLVRDSETRSTLYVVGGAILFAAVAAGAVMIGAPKKLFRFESD